MHKQRGFSVFKLLLFLAVLGAAAAAGYKIIPVYNAQWKIQDTFDSVALNMANETEFDIANRLPDLFHIKYLAHNDVPQEFYDNMVITSSDGKVTISSSYHVTVWLFGPVQDVDPESMYTEKDLKGMDKIRAKGRLDFDFKPYAETP